MLPGAEVTGKDFVAQMPLVSIIESATGSKAARRKLGQVLVLEKPIHRGDTFSGSLLGCYVRYDCSGSKPCILQFCCRTYHGPPDSTSYKICDRPSPPPPLLPGPQGGGARAGMTFPQTMPACVAVVPWAVIQQAPEGGGGGGGEICSGSTFAETSPACS